jgi:hypothetical protein
MEKIKEKLSDSEVINKIEKCCLGKKNFPREIIKLIPNIKYEPSPISKISHILYSNRIIGEENIQTNFSQEQVKIMLKGNYELVKFINKMKDKLISNFDNAEIVKTSSSSEINSESILCEKLKNRKLFFIKNRKQKN